jgi:two-component sensor histidine kinase
MKYAFPGGRSGIITISLSRGDIDHYLLEIADNGVGIPAGVINKKTGSLGMSLMTGLAEDLDGHFTVENNGGTTIKISFIHSLSRAFVSNN